MPNTYFDDPDFKNLLVSLLIKDHILLAQNLLTVDDFKPTSGVPLDRERWILANLALTHYAKYRQPIKDLIRVEVLEHCDQSRIDGRLKKQLLEFADHLRKKKVTGVHAITEKVLKYKSEVVRKEAVQELIDLQASGELTDEKFLTICREAVKSVDPGIIKSDYFDETEQNILARNARAHVQRYPLLFITPLDMLIRAIDRQHVGLVIAPANRGKSLMLIHIAQAYCIQKLNVLYITLEDPLADVIDRFDSSISFIPVKDLINKPKTLRSRMERFKTMARGRLRIVDGTDQKLSMAGISGLWETYRDEGFIADAVVVDYDDEIKPSRKQTERRFEFADIYRDIRFFAGSKNLFFWTAAQTQRGTEHLKILGKNTIAEDYSKVRKATLALGLGKGDWGDDSMFLWVVRHRNDISEVGCNIFTDTTRMRIYDHDRTMEKLKDEADALNP